MYLCELGKYNWGKSNNQNNETRFRWRAADSPSGRKTCDWGLPKRLCSKFSSSLPSSCSSIWFLQEWWKWKMFCFGVFFFTPAVSSWGLFQLWQSGKICFRSERYLENWSKKRNHLHTTESKSDNMCWFCGYYGNGNTFTLLSWRYHSYTVTFFFFCRAIKVVEKCNSIIHLIVLVLGSCD